MDDIDEHDLDVFLTNTVKLEDDSGLSSLDDSLEKAKEEPKDEYIKDEPGDNSRDNLLPGWSLSPSLDLLLPPPSHHPFQPTYAVATPLNANFRGRR